MSAVTVSVSAMVGPTSNSDHHGGFGEIMHDDPGDRYGVLQDQEKFEQRNLQGCWVREMD